MERFISVPCWLFTELHLSTSAALVYAVILGFTKNVGRYSGSAGYIAAALNLSRDRVYDLLRGLTERGLLCRTDELLEGKRVVIYRARVPPEIAEKCRTLTAEHHSGCGETPQGVRYNAADGAVKCRTNKLENKERGFLVDTFEFVGATGEGPLNI